MSIPRPRLLAPLRLLVPVSALAIAGLALLPGCVPLVIGGAGAATGYSLSQERSPGENFDDIGIRAQISQKWHEWKPELAEDVNATVYQGRVLITGRVPSEDWRAEAVKDSWQVENVKEVYDEVQVGPDPGFWQNTRDITVSTRLRTELLADPDVRSVNYTVTTVEGVVYIIGSARTQAELDGVLNHARNLADVHRVVSYVKIRPGAPEDQQPASAPPPAYAAPAASPPYPPTGAPPPPASGGPPPNYAPAPRQSIEVTPLQ